MRKLSDVILEQHPLIMNETAERDGGVRTDARQPGRIGSGDGRHRQAVGIFTGRDAVCRVLAEGRDAATTHLGEVMTKKPMAMSPDQTAIDALRLMWHGGFRHVPLIRTGHILGVVSRGDFKGAEFGRHEDERDLWEHMR